MTQDNGTTHRNSRDRETPLTALRKQNQDRTIFAMRINWRTTELLTVLAIAFSASLTACTQQKTADTNTTETTTTTATTGAATATAGTAGTTATTGTATTTAATDTTTAATDTTTAATTTTATTTATEDEESGEALATHPLDPLTAGEISETRKLLVQAGNFSGEDRFASMSLLEPDKAAAWNFKPGQLLERKSFSVIYKIKSNQTFEAVVNLASNKVESFKKANGQTQVAEDVTIARKAVRADEAWQAAMRKRGIRDLNEVYISVWTPGYLNATSKENPKRILKAIFFNRAKIPNAFFRPIEGVVADVDVVAGKVVKLSDTKQVPLPAALQASVPTELQAPNSVPAIPASYKINGNEVQWKNWRFRYGLNSREGLVLYTVSYNDHGKLRPILYRGSLSELCVPYGDPDPNWSFRDAFDVGHYGLGASTTSFAAMVDAPSNAKLLTSVIADPLGGPQKLVNAIAIFERDGGILWKHFDHPNRHNLSVRGTDLVVSSISTLGNYDYCFSWIFHEDGSLEVETGMTGVMLAKGIASNAASKHGHLVQDKVEAVHHQHFFCYRLDLDVDGSGDNSVVETNAMSIAQGKDNPYGNAFCMQETRLATEQQAKRLLNPASSRRWKVINEKSKNALGGQTGYMLIPGENSTAYASNSSYVRQRAGFLDAQVWATPYTAAQKFAAGDYPFQAPPGQGLASWVKENRRIEDKDVVLWYVQGITHTPRPEEWPIMPVHRASFKLIPNGFFAKNPALDYSP
ncbi:MAG TPA: primary-amine oxidase [Drouetiella sp.]